MVVTSQRVAVNNINLVDQYFEEASSRMSKHVEEWLFRDSYLTRGMKKRRLSKWEEFKIKITLRWDNLRVWLANKIAGDLQYYDE